MQTASKVEHVAKVGIIVSSAKKYRKKNFNS